jgi:hypothetical protein
MSGSAARAPWFDDLQRQLHCSRGFMRELDTQLQASFRELTGLELAAFRLAPPMPARFEVRTRGPVSTLAGDLVGSRLGVPVVIAWTDSERQRAPKPTDDVGPTDIELWWHSLPVEEIRAAESSQIEAPFDIARFSFDVDFALRLWPHVHLDIELREAMASDRLAAVKEVLSAARTKWNASRAERHGFIHNLRLDADAGAQQVRADVDFGSAGPRGLEFVLDELDALGAVATVRVSSY